MRLFDPILCKHGLQRVRDRPFEAHTRVPPMFGIRAVAEPLVGDAVAERVADAAVDDQQLAMRAVIEPAKIPPARLTVTGELGTASLQALELRLAGLRSAEGVDEHAHFHPGTRPLAQSIDELRLELARGPHERLEVHGLLGGGDVVEHRGVDRAVLQHCGAVAFVNAAFGETGDERQRIFDRRIVVRVEVDVRSAASASEQEP
jgi:hypothetical protein